MTIPRISNLYSQNNGNSASDVPFITTRDPTTADLIGPGGPWKAGQVWINTNTARISVLIKLTASNGVISAIWEDVVNGPSGIGTINTIGPDISGNFTLVAGSGITLTPGTNQITISSPVDGVGTLSDDVNTVVTPNAGNIQLVGHVVEQSGVPAKFSTVTAGTNLLNINPMSASRWIVDPLGFNGTHTTIQGAIDDATFGDTVFIMSGVYAETITLKVGVNLTAYAADAQNFGVTIQGSVTLAADGNVVISNIGFVTDGTYCVQVTGAFTPTLYLINCRFIAEDSSLILFSSLVSSEVYLINCVLDLNDLTSAYYLKTSAGNLYFYYCVLNNAIESDTASITNAGLTKIYYSIVKGIISATVDGYLDIAYTDFDTSILTVPAVAVNTSAPSTIFNCTMNTGNQSAVLIDGTSTLNMSQTSMRSSNASFAIDGTGTLIGSSLVFEDQYKINATITRNLGPKVDLDSYRALGQTAFLYYLAANTANNLTGNGTDYAIGTDALTQNYDQTSACTTGGTFTAPVTGIYSLGCVLTLQNIDPGHTTASVYLDHSSGDTYPLCLASAGAIQTLANTCILSGATQLKMDEGDTVVWHLVVSGSTQTIGLTGAATDYNTTIYGYQLA